MKKITKRQKELLLIIYKFIKDTGYPPTFEEMKERLDVVSNQSIINLLEVLENKKFIEREEGSARGIVINTRGYNTINKKPLVQMAGKTAAGPAMEAIEQKKWIDMPSGYKKLDFDLKDSFIVEVNGNSMIEAGIYDGDYVLIKKQEEYKSGDIVLARRGDDVTLKRFVYDNGRTYLKPENPACRIISITHDTFFLGKYIGKVQ
jgi:repressor LexA